MADKKLSALKFQDMEIGGQNGIEQDEVLTALRLLMRKVSGPVVRVCLEEARSDIAHLASTGDEKQLDVDLQGGFGESEDRATAA